MDEKQISFLVDFICESDLIEGIHDDRTALRTQLAEKQEKGHAGALLLLESSALEKQRFLDKDLVCKVQGLITSEQHLKPGGPRLEKEFIGRYRKVMVFIGGRPGCLPGMIEESMSALIEQIVAWQKNTTQLSLEGNIRRIADFHFDFEEIHPFADGNGRTGRALVYYLFRWMEANPFIFTHHDRFETYYPAFRARELMETYFLKRDQNGDRDKK